MFNENPRSRSLWIRVGAAAIFASLFLAAVLRAAAPAPLPSFSVQALDGTAVSNSSWMLKGRSIVIYVKAGNCQPCTGLLNTLHEKDYPRVAAHAIVIVGDAGAAEAKTLREHFPELESARWYADPSGSAARALQLPGAPVILGMNESTVAWVLSGVMPKPAQQQSVLNTWCAN